MQGDDKKIENLIAKLNNQLANLKKETKNILNVKRGVDKKIDKKLDEMAKYHQELGGFVKMLIDMNTRINELDYRVERCRRIYWWRTVVVIILSGLIIYVNYMTYIWALNVISNQQINEVYTTKPNPEKISL